MALQPGTRLGPYEVTVQIGVGGMGEVYQATDTNLDRQVAIKVLPEAMASDPERLARFDREAKTLAALNHPNIAQIHGLEKSDGTIALVMELVEGPTLADRIAQGAIPVDEALPIAKQIAEALEAAHEQGIIHRDLKPANVKVRPDGTVKVLDFGLAKAMEPAGAMSPGMSQSPTITTPAMTQAGMILGTAAYMSPEQAKGRSADKRSDVWAFGAVLYEMLTGKRAFAGEEVNDTLAAVLRAEPDWAMLPSRVPSAIRTLLTRCLTKEVRSRVADLSTVLYVLADPGPTSLSRSPTRPVLTRAQVAVVAAGALVTGAILAVAFDWATSGQPAPQRLTRTSITAIEASGMGIDGAGSLAATPDGTQVAYLGRARNGILVQSLDALEPVMLVEGINNLRGLFTSPDGQWVGYVERNFTLKRVAITGGAPETVLAMDGPSRGAVWLPDDSIILGTGSSTTGLQLVPAAGGPVTVLSRPDPERGEADHIWPALLPDRGAVLFTIVSASGDPSDDQVAVLDLASGTSRTVVRGGRAAQYVATGHLVYAVGNTLRAVAFDAERLETSGVSVEVLPRLVSDRGVPDVAVTANGTLFYMDAQEGSDVGDTLVWVDRQGRETDVGAPTDQYSHPRASPDGTRLAVTVNQDLWVWDVAGATFSRLTFDPANDWFPFWSSDGRRIVFGSWRAGNLSNIYTQLADGTGQVERLTASENLQNPTGLSSTEVVYYETSGRGGDLFVMSLDQADRVEALVTTPSDDRNGVISPDGRWLAYESDVVSAGRFEVFVRPYPNVNDGQWQASVDGGVQPVWARDSGELFYRANDGSLMLVLPQTEGLTWRASSPTRLFTGSYVLARADLGRHYDVTSDGQRFLMIKEPESTTSPQIVVVQNWFSELERLVPVD